LRLVGGALGWPGHDSRDFDVKTDDLHFGTGRDLARAFGDDGEPVCQGQRGEDV
jgi:hypothetical protein